MKKASLHIISPVQKTMAHFVMPYLSMPTNPITVHLIGAGGTGSHLLAALGSIHHDLKGYHHPGLQVKVFDDDIVTRYNIGRQGFALTEIGMPKAVAIVNRVNRYYGTRWTAEVSEINPKTVKKPYGELAANIIITCVDTAKARFQIAEMLSQLPKQSRGPNAPYYWVDFGNSKSTGQVILSTLQPIVQPKSNLYESVAELPMITTEFKELLKKEDSKQETSCSLAASRNRQDLFINRILAQFGGKLVNDLFYQPVIESRGMFINIENFNVRPLRMPSTIRMQNLNQSASGKQRA